MGVKDNEQPGTGYPPSATWDKPLDQIQFFYFPCTRTGRCTDPQNRPENPAPPPGWKWSVDSKGYSRRYRYKAEGYHGRWKYVNESRKPSEWDGIRKCSNCEKRYCPTCAPYDTEKKQFLCAGEAGEECKEFCSRKKAQNDQLDLNFDNPAQQHNVSKAVCKLRNGRPNKGPAKLKKLKPSMHVEAPKLTSHLVRQQGLSRTETKSGGVHDLPPGWTTGTHNGRTCYVDLNGKSQWEKPTGDSPFGSNSRRRRLTAAEILASRRPRTPPVLARLLEEIREANRRANRKSANQA